MSLFITVMEISPTVINYMKNIHLKNRLTNYHGADKKLVQWQLLLATLQTVYCSLRMISPLRTRCTCKRAVVALSVTRRTFMFTWCQGLSSVSFLGVKNRLTYYHGADKKLVCSGNFCLWSTPVVPSFLMIRRMQSDIVVPPSPHL